MQRRTLFASLVGSCAGIIMAFSLAASTAPAGAATSVPPVLRVVPNNVMVNITVKVIGKHFTPHQSVVLSECSQTNWVVPANPCDTNNMVTATANKYGAFTAKLKAEACPAPATPGIAEQCYVGVATPTGIDTMGLRPYASLVVTFP